MLVNMMTPILMMTLQMLRRHSTIHKSLHTTATKGQMKRRFPALKYGLRLKLANTLPVNVATTVFHNITLIIEKTKPWKILNFMISLPHGGLLGFVLTIPVDLISPEVHYFGGKMALDVHLWKVAFCEKISGK